MNILLNTILVDEIEFESLLSVWSIQLKSATEYFEVKQHVFYPSKKRVDIEISREFAVRSA